MQVCLASRNSWIVPLVSITTMLYPYASYLSTVHYISGCATKRYASTLFKSCSCMLALIRLIV